MGTLLGRDPWKLHCHACSRMAMKEQTKWFWPSPSWGRHRCLGGRRPAGKLRRRTRTLSTLSVTFHDHPTTCSRLAFGELLQSKEYALKLIRSVYSRLKWGKGLSAISHQICGADGKSGKREQVARPPMLVVVGWAGNDVRGDYGYSIKDDSGSTLPTSPDQTPTGRSLPTMSRSNTRRS